MSLAKKRRAGLKAISHKNKIAAAVVIAALLVLATLIAAVRHPTAPLGSNLSAQVGGNGHIFIIEKQLESGSHRLLVMDPVSLEVKDSMTTGDRPNARLSPDRSTLYLFSTNWDTNRHTLTATDSGTLETVWQIEVPALRTSFVKRPNAGIWLSEDGQFVYLYATIDETVPHITVVDTQARKIIREFSISLPYPATMRYPIVSKLPWSEHLVVLSGDVLFLINLSDGQQSEMQTLPFFEDRGQIPKNLPQRFVLGYEGVIDTFSKQLILFTTAQDIITVDLSQMPFTPNRVLTLPAGWQFSSFVSPHLRAEEETIYLPVRRISSRNSEPDEVWVYDISTWTQASRLDLSSQNLRSVDPTALNDVFVYPTSMRTLLFVGKDGNRDTVLSVLTIEGTSSLSEFYVVP